MSYNQEVMHKCIYCMQDKPASDFNTEHVISRMMGTYDGNGLVLNHCEVCEECNKFFSQVLESEISLDSYEAMARFKYVHRPSAKKRKLGGSRLSYRGETSSFRGMPLQGYVSEDRYSEFQFDLQPFVAIYDYMHTKQYCFYHIDEIPLLTPTDVKMLQKLNKPIIFTGYQPEAVEKAIKSIGISISELRLGRCGFTEAFSPEKIRISAYCKTDLYTWRYAGKVLMNFVCHMYGKDFVLHPSFNRLRGYIRYGTELDVQKFFSAKSAVSGLPNIEGNCHVVGTALTLYKGEHYLCGFVSWFNEFLYVFLLCHSCNEEGNDLPTRWMVCNNTTRRISIGKKSDVVTLTWPDNTKE